MSWQAAEVAETSEVAEARSTAIGRVARSRLVTRFGRDKVAMTALVFLAGLIVIAVFAPRIAPYSPTQNFPAINAGPSRAHWLGTDWIGRDLMTRLMYGARVSLEAAFVSVVLALLIALPLGLIAGYFRGATDSVIMRVMDAMFAFPPLLLAITITAFLGKSLHNVIIAIAVTFIPGMVRVIRGQVLSVREETFIEASQSAGAGPRRMLVRHVLPNVASPLIVQSALAFGFAILAEAGLSFLGLGVQPPAASWGVMLQEQYQYVLSNVWGALIPGVAIALTVLAFNLVGDGMRDALGRERVAGKA
ncbi:MAG TPA: ABC transporter permease [Acidimicrobiales bacterium]|nr:ABC transporter permease [Acidimicrobiales bacterium]